jgi:plastocyanin
MDRRRGASAARRVGRAVAGVAVALTIVVAPSASRAQPSIFPTSGALFGAFVQPGSHTGPDRRSALTSFESLVGRDIAIERVYYFWDQAWPTADDAWTRDAGRIPFISWNAARTDGTKAKWADIASGVYDSVIQARAADLIAFGGPVIFSFHHEPDGDVAAGTPAEFVAAFRHIHAVFDAAGVTNVTYAWTMTAWSFRSSQAASYYPGDDDVDVIAADGYNWYTCPGVSGPWRSFTNIFAPFHTFGQQHGKPMIVAEWGGREDPATPGRKATWIDEASTQLKEWPDIVGVLYYDADKGCARWVDTSPSSLASFQAMAADPYFNPPPTISITSGPAVATTARSATVRFAAPGAAGYRCVLDGGPPTACDSGKWSRTGLALGSHVFETWAVDGSGAATTDHTRWAWTIVPWATIDVQDFAFSPTSRTPAQDTAVLFRFLGPSQHTVTDTSGLGLFDSGPLPAGTTYTVPVLGAGQYPFACTIHPSMTGVLKVGLVATPSSGSTTTAFTIQWAVGQAPTGYVFDVQIKRPGTTTWKALATDTTGGQLAFTPDKGAGTYSFRARTQVSGGTASTQWSVAKSVTVG